MFLGIRQVMERKRVLDSTPPELNGAPIAATRQEGARFAAAFRRGCYRGCTSSEYRLRDVRASLPVLELAEEVPVATGTAKWFDDAKTYGSSALAKAVRTCSRQSSEAAADSLETSPGVGGFDMTHPLGEGPRSKERAARVGAFVGARGRSPAASRLTRGGFMHNKEIWFDRRPRLDG